MIRVPVSSSGVVRSQAPAPAGAHTHKIMRTPLRRSARLIALRLDTKNHPVSSATVRICAFVKSRQEVGKGVRDANIPRNSAKPSRVLTCSTAVRERQSRFCRIDHARRPDSICGDIRPSIRSHPRRGLIFCSGDLGRPDTGERLHGTLTSEAHVIFGNLKLLLEAAGSSLDRLVQVHALIYDSIEYDVLNRVYRQYVAGGPPARTVWSAQIEAGFKVELDVIAAA